MDSAGQQSGRDPESDLNSLDALAGAHQADETTAGNNDGGSDSCCDVDDEDTIEFEIEIVSSNTTSRPGSLTDLRDEETIAAQTEQEPQLDSTGQSELPIVDITNDADSFEAREELDELTTAASSALDQTEKAPSSEYGLEVIGEAASPEASTFIEIINSVDSGNEIEIELVEQEREKANQESNVGLIREERAVGQEDEKRETIESEMKLKEINEEVEDSLAETAQSKNDDLIGFSARPELADDTVADQQHVVSQTISASGQQLAAERQPTISGARNFTVVESVGSKNIREIYKVLNSDSVLIVGSRPEIVVEAAAARRRANEQTETAAVTAALEEEPAMSAEQEMVTFDTPKDELQPTTPQSPEITIEHSHEIAPSIVPDNMSCSGDESEDLEWEFDHEPVFEERDIQVKRGRDPRDEYELGDELGRGKFGTVFRCTNKESGRKLAAKFVLTRRKEDREDVEREVEIMCRLQHKRLLQLYDAFDNGSSEMCLITELVEGGELFERIVDDDFDLTEKKAAIFMRQICEGVEYMHSQNIVHLDMKPENILCVSRTGNRIKLIDFGLARQLDPDKSLQVMFGTPDFAAPEVLCYETVSLSTDMWSVGVICYVLLSGLSPFMGNNDMETMANVTRAAYDFDEAAFDPISDLAKDFISKLLLRDQTKRLKPSECLQHAWLARGGVQLEAAVRERRKSIAVESQLEQFSSTQISEDDVARLNALAFSLTVSLDKRNLKKYVVRRKWHKTVHAIMALGRMGAKLKARLVV